MIVSNTMARTSGGWYRPLAYALSLIESDRPRSERRELVDLLSTAAEFYNMGHEKGYEEAARKERDEKEHGNVGKDS